MAGTAVDRGGMFGVGVALDIRVAIGAVQAPVNAGFLPRSVHIYAVASLVLQAILAVAGKALRIFLRGNPGGGESKNEYSR
jgi:hypothetical protein